MEIKLTKKGIPIKNEGFPISMWYYLASKEVKSNKFVP